MTIWDFSKRRLRVALDSVVIERRQIARQWARFANREFGKALIDIGRVMAAQSTNAVGLCEAGTCANCDTLRGSAGNFATATEIEEIFRLLSMGATPDFMTQQKSKGRA